MERLSKSQAKDYYLLTEVDLIDLTYITKNNFLNSSNDIKLYKKEDVMYKALNKYGNFDTIINKIDNKRKEKIKKNINNQNTKKNRQESLLKYFDKKEKYINEEDILSEYPCYLYVEYNEKKFLKEVNNKISYELENIYQISSDRIHRRVLLLDYSKKKNLIIKPESIPYNNYINADINFEDTVELIHQENFWNDTKIFNLIIKKHSEINIPIEDIEIIKDDCIYYYLVSTNNPINFPRLIKSQVDKIIKIILFVKENSNVDLTNNNTISYENFLNIIEKRDNLVKELLIKKNYENIPEIILNKFSKANNNIIYNINI